MVQIKTNKQKISLFTLVLYETPPPVCLEEDFLCRISVVKVDFEMPNFKDQLGEVGVLAGDSGAQWAPNPSFWIINPEVYGFVDQPSVDWAFSSLKCWLVVSSLQGSWPFSSR